MVFKQNLRNEIVKRKMTCFVGKRKSLFQEFPVHPFQNGEDEETNHSNPQSD